MKQIYKILVPTDYTSVAKVALDHAIRIAKIMDGEIILLHVIDKDEHIASASKELQPTVDEVIAKHNIPTVGKVVTGNIFEDINKVAEYEGARLIIMGTHGRRGIQYLIGSYAMKIITGSTIPFLVVQERQIPEKYSNIVFPIDFKSETKLKISLTASMARSFGAKIHIFGEYDEDPFLKKNIDNNIAYAKKFFDEHNIDYTVKLSEKSGDFVKQITRYAVSINADMLAVLNLNYRSISVFLKNAEEELITNEAQIPVLMVNPSKDFIDSSPLFGDFQILRK